MKRLIIAIALAGAAFTAQAKTDCEIMQTLATSIMNARQGGMPMSEMLEITSASEISRTMTVDAYSVPRFNTEQLKQRAVSDFRDRVFSECYKAMNQ